MTQRLRIGNCGLRMDWDDNGAYVYYKSHKEIVEMLNDQLNTTQKLLDEERQYSRQLVERVMANK